MKKSILFILCLLTYLYYINTNTHNFNYYPSYLSNSSNPQTTIKPTDSTTDNCLTSRYNSLQQSIAKKIIRFHIIGNSNSYEDQAIKLKIKDAITKTYSSLFYNVNNYNSARRLAQENLTNITSTAQDILSNHGISYSVTTKLSTRNFPIKQYKNTILPAGKYEAICIELGEAKGRNWWCVFYPSLCVINSNTSTSCPSLSPFSNILTLEEYEYITYNPNSKLRYTSLFSELLFN